MSLVNNSANNFKDFLDAIKPYLNYQFYDLSGQGVEANNFSTDEKVIGTWIDGKPLYQKTIQLTNPTWVVPASGNKNETPPSSYTSIGASIDNVINCVTMMKTKTTKASFYPISSYMVSGNILNGTEPSWDAFEGVRVVIESNTFQTNPNTIRLIANTQSYCEGFDYISIIRYTKTTDSPVASGEKIVGQWVDGKPLYEKSGTFTESDFESGRVQTWNYFDLLGLTDASTTIDISGIILSSNYGVAPIGTPKTVAETSYYFGSYFNYRKRIVIDNHLPAGAVTDFKLNITVRYTKTT